MTATGLTETLAGKLFYVYIGHLTSRPVDLPKFMIVAIASKPTTCIVLVQDDELPTLETVKIDKSFPKYFARTQSSLMLSQCRCILGHMIDFRSLVMIFTC